VPYKFVKGVKNESEGLATIILLGAFTTVGDSSLTSTTTRTIIVLIIAGFTIC
jgi:hypothetical protein